MGGPRERKEEEEGEEASDFANFACDYPLVKSWPDTRCTSRQLGVIQRLSLGEMGDNYLPRVLCVPSLSQKREKRAPLQFVLSNSRSSLCSSCFPASAQLGPRSTGAVGQLLLGKLLPARQTGTPPSWLDSWAALPKVSLF